MYTKEQLVKHKYFDEALGRREVSIVLDPLDGLRLCEALGCSFEEFLEEHAELGVVDVA